jgi:hypothetical protein
VQTIRPIIYRCLELFAVDAKDHKNKQK